jgi:hypothetical protein
MTNVKKKKKNLTTVPKKLKYLRTYLTKEGQHLFIGNYGQLREKMVKFLKISYPSIGIDNTEGTMHAEN